MSKPVDNYNSLCEEFSKKHNAEISKMFGMPCMKIKSKAFCGLFNDDMIFKLSGDSHAKALTLKGTKLFDPMGGRPMKEWVQVPVKYADHWKEFAGASLKYVSKR